MGNYDRSGGFVIDWNSKRLSVMQGDITSASTNGILISCNPTMKLYPDHVTVSGMIASSAGLVFRQAVREYNKTHPSVEVGNAVAFPGGELKADWIICVSATHRVNLKEAYVNAFAIVDEKKLISVCFCCFGSGALRIDIELSAEAAISVLDEMMNGGKLKALKDITIMDIRPNNVIRIKNTFRSKVPFLTGATVVEDTRKNQDNTAEEQASCLNIDNFTVPFSPTTVDDNKGELDDVCSICHGNFAEEDGGEVVKMKKCDHFFHKSCIQLSFTKLQAQCPVCKKWYGAPHGNQPLNSTMQFYLRKGTVPGYDDVKGYYVIKYEIPSGIQTNEHLRPGTLYYGIRRTAYLPDNEKGRKVLQLFRLAFSCRLMFTVGDSITTGMRNVVTWNGIHNKTSLYGGAEKYVNALFFRCVHFYNSGSSDMLYRITVSFGYPDPSYLDRVLEELASMGITEKLLESSEY
ncbi:hypothetical protein AB6A40_002154 [Gnathostoma spinigerum]|uniref:E3 ubiquitin-protein ligase n=1 Tax=Gnathostoma spinigerum TaxID=75299 RepID=A0ABD6E6Y1_9BILA